jgi:Spy/CpxP family protein refolding chaperone
VISWRTPLLAAISFSLMGQAPDDRYESLTRALALTDAQMSQLPQVSPAPVRAAPTGGRFQTYAPHILPVAFPQAGDLIPGSVLDRAQQAKLAEIGKVLQRSHTAEAEGAFVLGLIDAREWPWGWACGPGPIGTYAQEFALSDVQQREFQQLEQAARQPLRDQGLAVQKRRRELLDSGASGNSPEVVQLTTEISQLSKREWDTRPPHDAALALLNGTQRARLAEFQADLELGREAAELGLVVAPWAGDGFCH